MNFDDRLDDIDEDERLYVCADCATARGVGRTDYRFRLRNRIGLLGAKDSPREGGDGDDE